MLAYYGYDIHDLARGASFEEVCYLLWHGRLPNRAELGDLQSQLAADRPLDESILRLMKQLPATDGMDMLRTLTSALGQYDPLTGENSPQANYRKAVRLTAQMASIVATYGRMKAGGGPIQPDPALGHAANFLYMLTGQRPTALATKAFDIALVLHDMPGSEAPRTITARFTYVRFHGSTGRYNGAYPRDTLEDWAEWLLASNVSGFAYFNNDVGGHAPRDAVRLRERIRRDGGGAYDARPA